MNDKLDTKAKIHFLRRLSPVDSVSARLKWVMAAQSNKFKTRVHWNTSQGVGSWGEHERKSVVHSERRLFAALAAVAVVGVTAVTVVVSVATVATVAAIAAVAVVAVAVVVVVVVVMAVVVAVVVAVAMAVVVVVLGAVSRHVASDVAALAEDLDANLNLILRNVVVLDILGGQIASILSDEGDVE